MAITISEELIEGASVVEDSTGLTVVRHFVVYGLTTGRRLLIDALTAVDSANATKKIPEYNEPHPDIDTVFASKIEPKAFLNSRTDAHVYVTYRPLQFDLGSSSSPIVTFYGSTREVVTNIDAQGRTIKVGYTPSTAGSGYPRQVGLVTGTKAIGLLTFDFVSYNSPDGLASNLNKINSRAWRGYGKYAWLCSTVEIEKIKFRPGWHIRMGFQLDPELFSKVAFYRLQNGVIPNDVPDAIDKTRPNMAGIQGFSVVLVNGETDFNSIGLIAGF
jgi:hypothetical protein